MTSPKLRHLGITMQITLQAYKQGNDTLSVQEEAYTSPGVTIT